MPFVAEVNSKTGEGFEKAPAGTHPGVLVAIIDLGTQYTEYKGEGKWARELFWVWELLGVKMSGTKDRCHVVGTNLRFSLNRKAKMYEVIKGRTGKDIPEGTQYDVSQELGKPCLVSVVQNGDYTNFGGVMALPAALATMLPAQTYPTTEVHLDDYLAGKAAIPPWVPFNYGKSVADVIKTCKEVAGDRGARGGVPQGQRNGEYPADKPDSDDIPF